jgi:fluoride exporter
MLGGFTTYSAFSYETLTLLQDDAWAIAIVNVAATALGCLVRCLLGQSTAKLLLRG